MEARNDGRRKRKRFVVIGKVGRDGMQPRLAARRRWRWRWSG